MIHPEGAQPPEGTPVDPYIGRRGFDSERGQAPTEVVLAGGERGSSTGMPVPTEGGRGLHPREVHAKEMAQAFRMNAEALSRLQKMQEDLAKSVRRSDRSEMVLQSTEALNDTFRNLTYVQKELLDRIDEGKRARARSPLIPLMILGVLAAVIGCTYAIIKRIESAAGTREDTELTAERLMESFQDGRRDAMTLSETRLESLKSELDEERRRRQERVDEFEEQLAKKKSESEELRRQNDRLQIEQAEMAQQVKRGHHLAVEKQVLEDQLKQVATKQATVDNVIGRLQADLARAKRDNTELRSRFAAHGLGLPPDPNYGDEADNYPPPPSTLDLRTGKNRSVGDDVPAANRSSNRSREDKIREAKNILRDMERRGDPRVSRSNTPLRSPRAGAVAPVAPSSGRAASTKRDTPVSRPAAARVVGSGDLDSPPGLASRSSSRAGPRQPIMNAPRVDRARAGSSVQAAESTRIKKMLNRLLAASTTSRTGEFWQLKQVRSLRADCFEGIEAWRYDESGHVVEKINAGEMRVFVDRSRHVVEFVFRAGQRTMGPRREALNVRGHTALIAEGKDQAQSWVSSGLKMIRVR